MITKATFIIECDNCSEEIEIDGTRTLGIREHYEPSWDAMRFLGWTKAFGHDLCPSCSKEENEDESKSM